MGYKIGISGATGVTGEVTLRILRERNFPVDELRLFASKRSAGRRIRFGDTDLEVEALDDRRFGGLDLIISATSSSLAREVVPSMVEAGAIVIDQSSAFRLDPDVPLVVPEINGDEISRHKGIIAGPNCTTAVAIMPIAALHGAFGVSAVISSAYQSVSGVGRDAIEEFSESSRKALDQIEGLRGHEPLDLPEPQQFPAQIAFNIFPQCESFRPGEDTSTEEEKMQAEMRKMLGLPELHVHATAVRVPVVVGHAISLSVALERPATPDEARKAIAAFPGVKVLDDPSAGVYPTPVDSAGIDEILVGRIRPNPILPNGLALFSCGDNLRKGNALNAIQVAERLLGI